MIKNKALGNIAQKIRGIRDVFRAGNDSSMPSIEEIFKCIAFRIAGGNLTPRISHITGGNPLDLEGYVPRLSCLKGLFEKPEQTTAAVKHVRAKPVEPARARVAPLPTRSGFGVKIPAKPPEVRAVPARSPKVRAAAPSAPAPVKRAPVRAAAPPTSVKRAPAPVRVKQAPQLQPQPQPRYIIKP